jgi:hypothetical protein
MLLSRLFGVEFPGEEIQGGQDVPPAMEIGGSRSDHFSEEQRMALLGIPEALPCAISLDSVAEARRTKITKALQNICGLPNKARSWHCADRTAKAGRQHGTSPAHWMSLGFPTSARRLPQISA